VSIRSEFDFSALACFNIFAEIPFAGVSDITVWNGNIARERAIWKDIHTDWVGLHP